MKDQIKNLEIKKLVQEYNFLLSDDEYKKELIESNKSEFLKNIQQTRVELGLPSPEPIIQNPNEESTIKENDKKKINPDLIDFETKIKIKKIYREIVKKTHPDRIGSDEHLDIYTKATIAADEFDMFTLFKICVELNITFNLDQNDKSLLEILINLKKEELIGLESSFIWKWINAKNENEKNSIISLFLTNYG